MNMDKKTIRIRFRQALYQTNKIFRKFVLAVAKHLFLDCSFIFLLMLFIAWFSYYRYNIIISKAELESFEEPFLLEQSGYQKVINAWQENEKKFKEANIKNYANLFEEPEQSPKNEK